MKFWTKKRQIAPISEINLTPFVDILFTILIIYMLTAPFMQQGLPVNLPKAQSTSLKRSKSDMVVTIQNSGKVFLGDDARPLSLDELSGILKSAYETKQQKDLFIKADSNIKYGTVVDVMSVAKKAGADRIGMLTQPEVK